MWTPSEENRKKYTNKLQTLSKTNDGINADTQQTIRVIQNYTHYTKIKLGNLEGCVSLLDFFIMYSEIILDEVRIFNPIGLLGGNIVIIDRGT